MMNNIERPRLLALDVDGTLTRSEGSVETELVNALKNVAATGVTVVLATGRGNVAMRELAQCFYPYAYAVLNNGAVIRSIGKDRVVRARHMGLETARSILREFRQRCLCAVWVESPYAGDRYLVDGAWWTHSATRTYLASKGSAVRPLLDPTIAAPPVHVFAFGSAAVVRATEQKLRQQEAGKISLVRWRSTRLRASIIEVLPAGVTKGEAVAWLANHLDIKPSQALAVGDDRNDIEMLSWAGHSVAIEGSPPDVLALADQVAVNDGEGAVRRIVREIWGV